MKIVITGAHGMLGRMLTEVFAQHELFLAGRTELDITDKSAVESYMTATKPDCILNAAAYTAVDDCETNSETANQVNGAAPGYLAAAAKAIDAALVHFSTDYIFNGQEAAGYNELCAKIDPVNAYGRSKALGEQAILNVADAQWNKYYIIRTAWLYGPHGNNFVDTMLKLADEKNELKVVNDQHGSPTYTKDLAQQTEYILREKLPYGIYHATNSGSCTWFEFAQEIMRLANKSIAVLPCTSDEFPRPAKRPAYSILVNTKLPTLRPWQKALTDYLNTKAKA